MTTDADAEASTGSRYVIDWGKLTTLALIITSTTTLCLAGKVSGEVVIGVMLLVTGYTAGNGVQARRRQSPQPLIGATGDRRDNDSKGPE